MTAAHIQARTNYPYPVLYTNLKHSVKMIAGLITDGSLISSDYAIPYFLRHFFIIYSASYDHCCKF